MNLKTVWHYSYFVHPFLIKGNRYKGFIGKLMNDDHWKIDLQGDRIDVNTHSYFLPYVKKFLFPTLFWTREYREEFECMSASRRLDIVTKLPCISFDYFIDTKDRDNYKFSKETLDVEITRVQLICFETGISFLILKTTLEKEDGVCSDDILNFNYKFRTINPRYLKKKKTEGLAIKNAGFTGLEDLAGFIGQLLYGFEDVARENIYFDRLFTYSYMCLDETEWNEERPFSEIINEFYKFQYILPSDYGSTFDEHYKDVKGNTYVRWKYSIYGFSRESGVVMSSNRELFNVTKLPQYYETIYFYIFLLAFYQRISLILFSEELMGSDTAGVDELKERFTRFTHFSWFSQITNSENGTDVWKKWQKAFDLPAQYEEVQKEYSEFYEYKVAKGQERINVLLIVIYVISVVFSGLTLMVDLKVEWLNSDLGRVFLQFSLLITVALYPVYRFSKWLTRMLKMQKKLKVTHRPE
jgi:hypothetical protein